MVFWVLAALITGAVVISILWPLNKARGNPEEPVRDAVADVNVYKDQLRELEAEAERGAISPAEVEAARAEVSRRLLAAAEAADQGLHQRTFKVPVQAIALTCAVFIPIATLAVYLASGAPGYPDFPRSARLQPPTPETPVSELVARVEARLKEVPDDGQGWEVIAPVYARQGRLAEAKLAYEKAIELLGESSERLGGLANTLLMINNGVVTDEAIGIYRRLAAREPDAPGPRFWLAVGREQRGELVAARAEYRSLLAEAPSKAPWKTTVEQRLAAVDARLAGAPLRQGAGPANAGTEGVPTPADQNPNQAGDERLSGPTQDDVAAASKLSYAERALMVQGMVDNLAARLSESGGNTVEWQRLMKAYMVLEQPEKARSALANAKRALADLPEQLAQVEAYARKLGLTGQAEPTKP